MGKADIPAVLHAHVIGKQRAGRSRIVSGSGRSEIWFCGWVNRSGVSGI